ncbi:MAG: hypothetical protein LLF89_11180 [Spirochaetaceae bacterium]|nr:hypothetical protein [Spirochaetaceae bacterium]
MKLLLMAGGVGSRFGGIKQLASVGTSGETLLEYNIHNALSAGFNSIVFLIRRETEEDFRDRILARLPACIPVELAYQDSLSQVPADIAAELDVWLQRSGRTKPWGTGHALLCARHCLDGRSGADGDRPADGNRFAVVNADDFYGRSAFAAIHGFFADMACADAVQAHKGQTDQTSPAGRSRFCFAAYELGSVLSEKGSVSRAICTLGPGNSLAKITEHVHVERKDGRILSRKFDGRLEEFGPHEPVSMNIWGLDSTIFPQAEALFRNFIVNPSNWGKGEFYLPSIIDSMISGGVAEVTALPVTEQYFGLTNPEDLADVRAHIAAMTAQGVYPAPLWKDFREEAGR